MRAHSLLGAFALTATGASASHAFQRPPPACDAFAAAVRANPNDLRAAASLGRCSVRDYEMLAVAGDSTRMVFRSSWSTALRALRRAAELDPSYADTYRPLFRILFADTRDGCSSVTGQCLYVSSVVRSGDSVLTILRLVRLNTDVDTYDEVMQESQSTRVANLSEARDLARRWAAVSPDDRRPHEYLGQALLQLGHADSAVVELEHAAAMGSPASRRELFWDRLEALIRADRGTDARRVLDEAVSDPGRDTASLRAYTVAGVNALLGRSRPPPVDSARARIQRARIDSILRNRPPAPPRSPGVSELLARGDTNGARKALAQQDSLFETHRAPRRMLQMGAVLLESAELRLAVGDTAGALTRLETIERAFHERYFRYSVSSAYGPELWSGRAWLLSGNLAAARGNLDEARRMYRRAIGLWEGGDPEAQTVVDTARARLRALPSRQ